MTRQTAFTSNLLLWYRKNARDLPWRQTSDPYKIWISEVMLQQTTVTAATPYYQRWIKLFPDVQSVARAPLQKLLHTWQGLGYYQRAKNIHRAAKLIVENFEGQLPSAPDQLRTLPGFGPYTTGAVMSIAFGKRHPIVDANVRRVVMRILLIHGKATSAHDCRILNFLEEHMPHKNISSFNQALMELGALVCRSRTPQCQLCPERKICQAYQHGKEEIIPTPQTKPLEDVHAVIAVIRRGQKVFIQQRPEKGLLAGLWEFPGGKIDPGETKLGALKRELREELFVDLKSVQHLLDIRHFYTKYRVHLSAWNCVVNPEPRADEKHRWVTRAQLKQYPMPAANLRIIEQVFTGPQR